MFKESSLHQNVKEGNNNNNNAHHEKQLESFFKKFFFVEKTTRKGTPTTIYHSKQPQCFSQEVLFIETIIIRKGKPTTQITSDNYNLSLTESSSPKHQEETTPTYFIYHTITTFLSANTTIVDSRKYCFSFRIHAEHYGKLSTNPTNCANRQSSCRGFGYD